MTIADRLIRITRKLQRDVDALSFSAPVHTVYNPLAYARGPHEQYVRRYAVHGASTLFLGMNPGPFGMGQTGIAFGDATVVREWLRIDAPVVPPKTMHPKRPVIGLNATRREVSGRRLWEWVAERFKTPERFFREHFVFNYCPLAFLEASGRNRTPDKLPVSERQPLLECCDLALKKLVVTMGIKRIVGIGAFAQSSAQRALDGVPHLAIHTIAHPSPANPKANRGWQPLIEAQLRAQGFNIPE